MADEGNLGLADVLALFRANRPLSRVQVMEMTGLSRSTVNARLAGLLERGFIASVPGGESTGGRPSSRFALRTDGALFLTADVGASGFTAAACDFSGAPLRHSTQSIDVREGPEPVLAAVDRAFRELWQGDEVHAIGIAVPGPVEFAAGWVVDPPIMTGWDGFGIASWFTDRYAVPTVVENDANARAIAESRERSADNLISLKLGTGVGAGLVFNGRIIRGNEGAAGDIGHTRAVPPPGESGERICRCGNLGCVEAYASGWALIRDLQELGADVHTVTDVVDLVRRGDFEAVRALRQAGRVVGEAVADLSSILNPSTIVLSGQLVGGGEVLLSGIRERVYQRVMPLATRKLEITQSNLGELAGVTGLAIAAADRILGQDGWGAMPETSHSAGEPNAASRTARSV